MKGLLCLIFFVVCAEAVFSQSSAFDPISDIETLSGIQVNDIKQDSIGFLWVGTNEGLYRYDGYRLKLYETNSNTIGTSIVRTLYFDKQGGLWAGTHGGLLKYNKSKDQFFTFKHDPKDTTSLHSNSINCITGDNENNLWIGLSKGGIDFYSSREKKFYHFLTSDKTGLSSDDISDISIDDQNNLWISTWNHGINKLDLNKPSNTIPHLAKFSAFNFKHNLPREVTILCIFEDTKTHDILVGTTDHGLFRFNKKLMEFKPLEIEGLERSSLYNVSRFSENKIWIATQRGVRLVDLDRLAVEDCEHPVCGLSGSVYVVFTDNQNIMWAGSETGLKKYVERKIKHHKLNKLKNEAPINNVIGMCKQGQYIWLGTWSEGLYLKDEQNEKFVRVNADNDLLKSIWDIKLINNKLLLVATSHGLVQLQVEDPSLKSYFKESNYPSDNHFTVLTKNTTGDTWLGTWKAGLFKVNGETGEVIKYDKFDAAPHYIQSLHLDKKGQLWIGTVHSGLIRLSELDGDVKFKVYSPSTSGLNNECINVIFEDQDEKLWLGTGGGGINIMDLETEEVRWIIKGKQNLPSNTVRAIIRDQNEDMWVTFQSGISKLDQHGVFINYTEDDGFETMSFSPKSALKDGLTLYFGNGRGYNSFNPSDLILYKDPPKVFITDFKIFDKSIAPGDVYEGNVVLDKPINELETLTLPYKIKNITFEFSALNFANPKREIFSYMLEGFNDTWIYTNASNRFVSYSNLSPGDYVLKIKTARNSDTGINQGRVLQIHISPPLWQTTWFIVIAVLLFAALLYLLHWIRLTGLRKQKIVFEKLANERVKVIEIKNRQLEEQNIEIQDQAARLHESDQSKINFFSNISHEFRTPLMLIVGPIAKLLESNELTENESLTMIHRNSKRLLRLIDQIMDFSKIEAGSLTLEPTEGDFIKFINEITASFNYLAKVKKITFEFHSEEETCFFYFDQDKLEKIIYNLLSNAFKVTPQSGRIAVGIENLYGTGDNNSLDGIRIEIFNTGKGISKEELPNLFTRFYRTKSYTDGTGIGLSLTKSLVELHGGTIEVKSEENQGTWFYVIIPVNRSEVSIAHPDLSQKYLTELMPEYVELVYPREGMLVQPEPNPNSKTILILDDDDDMRLFISKLLTPFYKVIECSNGQEALKRAYQFQPDLIVSDMMMPVMDGYQFLKIVKGDSNISHIPIILLTARASMDSRLKGLEEGADDYITKPFNEKMLLLRVKNLIDRMQRAKERFSTDINLEPKEITITSLDEKFMKDLLDIVEKNIANPNFGADIICQELGVGRSYLYAKVKALTDLPVNEFVRTIRLKRAAVLLTKSQLHVNEVAYNVGFNDRYYFSRCFLKLFGVSPAQYQKDNMAVNPLAS